MDPEFKLLVEFATDIMKFALAMNGYEYKSLFEVRDEWVPDTFEYVFGQAVFYYRESHRERFEEIVQSYHDLIFHDETTLLEYIKYGMQQVTKGDSLLMDFLRIMAFYADLIIYCQRFDDRKAYVALVMKYVTEIYNYAGVRDVLQVAGSYGFLGRVAEEIIGQGVYEESFMDRVIRYRRQLQQESPDRRRVSFALPEDSERNFSNLTPSSEKGRLACCLGMFETMPANHFEESGLTDKDNLSESKAGTSDVDWNAPSTSGTFVPPPYSSESEGEEPESVSGKKSSKKECISGIKKPQSILKSPHIIKGHKRTASDASASSRRKRTKTICCDESSETTANHPGDEDDDPKNLNQEILIPISDTLSDELRITLDKLLEEILNYNKTSEEPVIYDVQAVGAETRPELSELSELTETADPKTPIVDSDYSSVSPESSEANVSEPDGSDAKVIKPDVPENVQVEIREIKMDSDDCVMPSDETEACVSKHDDPLKFVTSEDSECSVLNEGLKTQNESVRTDAGSDSSVHLENSETSLIRLEPKQTGTEILNTPIADSGDSTEISDVKISLNLDDCSTPSEGSLTSISKPDDSSNILINSGSSAYKSDVPKDILVEAREIKRDSDDCNMSSKDCEAGYYKSDGSLKISTNDDSVCKSNVSKNAQAVIGGMDSNDSNMLTESPENSISERDASKTVTSSDSVCKSDVPKDARAEISEIKMDSYDCNLSSENSETIISKSDDSLKVMTSSDSICEVDASKDVQTEFREIKMDSDDCNMPSESSPTDISKPDDSSKMVTSSDSICKIDVPKDVQTEISEIKMDSDDCNVPPEGSATDISKPDDSSQILASGHSECSNLSEESNTKNESARMGTGAVSSANADESMECEE